MYKLAICPKVVDIMNLEIILLQHYIFANEKTSETQKGGYLLQMMAASKFQSWE